MSVFFALCTVSLWLFSHWWARRARLSEKDSSSVEKFFKGSLEKWENELQKTIKNNARLTIIEKSSTHLVINEAPGVFSYGAFHHVQWAKTQGGVAITFTIQPKLVISSTDVETRTKILSPNLTLKDAG